MLGSAKMLRETGEHPTVLRERVTSPGGTTAAAVRQLEDHKVRAAFITAMEAARDRSRDLARGRAAAASGQGASVTGRLVHSEELTRYDFGPRPRRWAPAGSGTRSRWPRSWACSTGSTSSPPPPIDDDLLLAVHTTATTSTPSRPDVPEPRRTGWARTDNPIFPRMHEVSATVAMATVGGGPQGLAGRGPRGPATSAAGCTTRCPGPTSGFCVYNDLAVAISWLLDQRLPSGSRTSTSTCTTATACRQIFYDDPRVLTISLHETPAVLFPGTGFPYEIGGPGALGSAVNVALPPGTGDAGWLRAFDAVVPQVLRAFQPQILVTQHGCDSHRHDPLADLELTVDGQRASYLALAELADELCEGRWVSTGGGGYAITNVVPRAWTHLLAIVGGEPLPPETPTRRRGGPSWARMPADGDDRRRRGELHRLRDGFSPTSRLDQAIIATRKAVFPELGLDPGALTGWSRVTDGCRRRSVRRRCGFVNGTRGPCRR